MSDFLHHPIVRGIIAGVLSAAVVDFNAFKSWHSFSDARQYSWGVAAWRWLQGAVIGGCSALGLAAF